MADAPIEAERRPEDSSPARLERLVALAHHRWSIPVLAELARRGGAKFSTLAYATGAAPGSVRASLDALIKQGWVIPNPGYGHPLRPEYILTDAGARLGSACLRVHQTLEELHIQDLCLRKWSLPVLDSIAGGASRFGEISARLGRITDRALSLCLGDLRSGALVDRPILASFRPSPVYVSTPLGARVAASLIGL